MLLLLLDAVSPPPKKRKIFHIDISVSCKVSSTEWLNPGLKTCSRQKTRGIIPSNRALEVILLSAWLTADFKLISCQGSASLRPLHSRRASSTYIRHWVLSKVPVLESALLSSNPFPPEVFKLS